ncbi:MAG: phosphoribosyltransferase domain-containing protein [Verrucomicrobiota bacterium]
MTPLPTEWREDTPGFYEARLPGGRFTLEMHREDLPFRELCDLAVRNNAKRRFLFVSQVLGRHCPVRPAAMRRVAAAIAAKLHARLSRKPEENAAGLSGLSDLSGLSGLSEITPAPGSVVFIGMAETATTLGQTVFREFLSQGGNGLYLESTRRSTGGAQAFGFAESHSHATAHVIHLPSPEDDPDHLLRTARHVVVVDDEATTAKTAAGLVHALKEWRGPGGAPFEAWLAVILRWKQGGENDAAFAGIESLAEGHFTFQPEGSLPESPAANNLIDSRVTARRGIRHGGRVPQSIPPEWKLTTRPDEKILVIGNGEYGFQPLLLAEAFENAGARAWLQATTRSPILPGGAIGHARAFEALSGEGHAEFLYNVPDDHGYDRVVLCLEDAEPPPDHPIRLIPRLEIRS